MTMSAWLRNNSSALALAFAVLTALAGVWVKAALADTNTRVAVLEAKRVEDADRMKRIEDGVNKLVDRFIDKSWGPR